MSRANPWARHYQAVWHERAANRNLPAWARVAFLAFGSHKANGHARFAPGEVALVLGSPPDPTTGEVQPMDRNNLQRAIRRAVQEGWLAPGSSALCLVVPAHAVEGGLGDAAEPCPLHDKRAARRAARPVLKVVGQ